MESKKVDVLVGGLMHELFRRGLVNDRNMLSAGALVSPSRHGLVVQAHEAFLEAGATLLVSGNYFVTPDLGFTPDEIREHSRVAGELTMEARARANREGSTKICGSLPPLMPSLRSDRTVEHQLGLDTYLLIGEALLSSVDLFLTETMSSLAEAQMAYEAVEPLQMPVMVSFALNSTGQLRSGEVIVESVKKLVAFCARRAELSPGGVGGKASLLCGVLFNCSQPEDIAKALKRLQEAPGLLSDLESKRIWVGGYGDRISAASKAGAMQQSLVPGTLKPVMDMEVFGKFAACWIEHGAQIVGGCCGISSEYLQRIVKILELP